MQGPLVSCVYVSVEGTTGPDEKLPRQQLPRRLLATQPFARLPTARQNITRQKINKTYFKPDKLLLFCNLTRQ